MEAINAAGTKVLYATYLSGSGMDVIGGIAADADGNAWVAGATESADYPVTADALQKTYPGKQG